MVAVAAVVEDYKVELKTVVLAAPAALVMYCFITRR
jgi:hypothetical protein